MPFYDAKFAQFGTVSWEDGGNLASIYGEDKAAIIYFGHAKSERVVSFNAFLDSFGLDVNYNADIYKPGAAPYGRVVQKASQFSYRINLKVPSESVNEARGNLAKFQELARYVNPPAEASGDANKATSYLYVLFANLIQNGMYYSSEMGMRIMDNFGDVKTYGARCFMININFEPDLELGFFEYNSKLIPKAYSMSLVLNFQPLLQQSIGDINSSVRAYNPDGSSNNDLPSWPFGITGFSVADMNDFRLPSIGEDGTSSPAERRGASIGFADMGETSYRWVAYKAFVDKFSYSKSLEVENIMDVAGDVTVSDVPYSINEQKYPLSFNVVAHSVNEGRANLIKFQNLIRFCIKKEESTSGEMYVYFHNLISNPHTPSFTALARSTIKGNGKLMVVKKCAFEVDMEMGMFEHNGFLIPKVFKVDLDLEDNGGGTYGIKEPLNRSQLAEGDDSRWPFGIDYT